MPVMACVCSKHHTTQLAAPSVDLLVSVASDAHAVSSGNSGVLESSVAAHSIQTSTGWCLFCHVVPILHCAADIGQNQKGEATSE